MKWYYQRLGSHTHVRVFMNGGKCGDLCFRNEEFVQIVAQSTYSTNPTIQFIDEQNNTQLLNYRKEDELAEKLSVEGDQPLHSD